MPAQREEAASQPNKALPPRLKRLEWLQNEIRRSLDEKHEGRPAPKAITRLPAISIGWYPFGWEILAGAGFDLPRVTLCRPQHHRKKERLRKRVPGVGDTHAEPSAVEKR